MRRAILAAASVLAGLLLQGCNEDKYELEVKPKGDDLEQTLTVYRIIDMGEGKPKVSESFSEAELDKLREMYKRDGKNGPGGRKVFTRLLRDAAPNPKGGQATFLRYPSDLGAVSLYFESLNQSDDLAGELEKRLESSNRLADLILQWFALELVLEPRAKDLLHWIEHDFRNDLKNVNLYLWQIKCSDFHGESNEWSSRLATYLINHGYLTKKEIPVLSRALLNLDSGEGDQAFFTWLQRFAARKMGIPDDKPIPESLAFLGSRAKLIASMQANIYKTKTYQLLKNDALKKGKVDENLSLLEADNPALGIPFFFSLLAAFNFFEDGPLLSQTYDWTVSLQVPVRPDWTNGVWKEKTGAVQWGMDEAGLDGVSFIYAIWAEPSERQTARFGKVLLDGQRLAAYALWFQALHENERAEWTAFVDTIKPGDDFKTALEGFRFKGEKDLDEKEVKPALSNAARDIFREALAPVEPEKP